MTDSPEPRDQQSAETLPVPSLPLPGQIVLAAVFVILTVLHARMGFGAYLFMQLSVTACVLLFLLSSGAPWTRLLTLAAVPAAFLAAAGPIPALRALMALPFGAAVAAAIARRRGRMSVIVLGASVAGLWMAGLFLLTLATEKMSVSALVDSFRAELMQILTSAELPNRMGGNTMLFSEESAEIFTREIIMILPAVLCWMYFLFSWFTTVLTRAVLRLLGAEKAVFPTGWRMRADRFAAVFFVLFQVLSFLFSISAKTQNLYYAFGNLPVIFMLPMAFVGGEEIIVRIRTSERFSPMTRLAAIFLVVMTALAASYFILLAAALYGVVLAFRRNKSDGTGKDGDG